MSKNNRSFVAQRRTKLSGSRKQFSEFKNKETVINMTKRGTQKVTERLRMLSL
jgi:hypothetical protein